MSRKGKRKKQNTEHRTQNKSANGEWRMANEKSTNRKSTISNSPLSAISHQPSVVRRSLSPIPYPLSPSYYLLSILLLAASVLLAYSNTFDSSFHLDDEPNIILNERIKKLFNLREIIRGTDRPIAMIVNALNFHYGKLEVRGYHYVNIGIHILTSLVLYFIFLNTFGLPVFSGKYAEKKQFLRHGDLSASQPRQAGVPTLPDNRNVDTSLCRNNYVTTQSVVTRTVLVPTLRVGMNIKHNYDNKKYFLSFAGTLIFALHPVQTQAITYIIQGRMAGLATLFYLSALLFFILGTKAQRVVSDQWSVVSASSSLSSSSSSGLNKTVGAHCNVPLLSSLITHHSSLFYFLAILSSALGMGTKEITVTAPIMILIYDYFFIANDDMRNLKKRMLVHICLFLTVGIVVFFSITGTKHAGGVGFRIKDFTPFQYLFTQFGVVLYYIILLLFPFRQNVDYDWHISKFFFEHGVIISFVLILLILVASVKIFKKHRLLFFCILWYFITLAPESTIIPIKDVIFEHRLYLPSTFFLLFFVLLFNDGLEFLRNKYKMKVEYFGYFILLCTGIILGILTYWRNDVWREEITLWQDCVKKSPNKARPYNNLGSAYNKIGQHKKALPFLQKAIKLDSTNTDAYNNLAVAYERAGEPEKAIPLLQKAIEIEPGYAPLHYNIGNIYFRFEKYVNAVKHYEKAISLTPNYISAYHNLGVSYKRLDKYDLAIKIFEKSIKLNPYKPNTYNSLGNVYLETGKYEKASIFYKKAIKLAPEYANAHHNLGVTYMKIGKYDMAIKSINKAIELNPSNSIYYRNLSEVYAMIKQNENMIQK